MEARVLSLRAASPAPAGFAGWTLSGNPSSDPKVGLPAPAWQVPGNSSYLWRDDHKPYSRFGFKMMSQGLADFFFSCDDAGKGQMFRIDTRANGNWAGFATTSSWTSWNAPSSGFYAAPDTWIAVALAVQGSRVLARCTWAGGAADVTLTGYKANGTAFGFQGDGLGATSYTWVSAFEASA